MEQEQKPSLALSFIPVVVLLGLLIVNNVIYKDDATGGANQLALLISAGVATLLESSFKKLIIKN
jgi:NhaC family Na+:H+ antiporter